MKLYKKSEIFSEKYNKNCELEISPEVQKKIMDGNAAFIIDLMLNQKISSFTISSLGIQLVNYFFIGKSYLNYDRFVNNIFLVISDCFLGINDEKIATKYYDRLDLQFDNNNIYCAAALMLAFKMKEQDHYRMKPIIMGYYQQAPRKDQTQIMNDQIYQSIKNKVCNYQFDSKSQGCLDNNIIINQFLKIFYQICIAESKIIKAIQFEFDIQLPFDYLQTIISNFCNEKEEDKERIYYATKVICYDSFRSYAPLIFKPQTIAVSAYIISCSQFNIEPHLRISEKLKEKYNPEGMREEEAYERWLQEVSLDLQQQITAEDIKDCLYVLNELLYLHYNPKEEDVKKFESYEQALQENKNQNNTNEKEKQNNNPEKETDKQQQQQMSSQQSQQSQQQKMELEQ